MTRKIIALLRVSTDAQDTARQRADMGRLTARFDLDIVRSLELHGVSGTATLDDEQVQQVLADLSRADVDGIGVSALDRLFRPGKRYGQFSILDRFVDEAKTIWSVREGFIDPSTDEGYDKCISAGGRAGAEWRELRRRTLDGKEALRAVGGNPNGTLVLPRGVGYEPIKDRSGRTVGARWFYTEPGASLVRKAYDLLFERRSWNDIAAQVGHGVTNHGVKSLLTNPLFMGVRRYIVGREEPLEVKVIDEPLISPERWHAAQAIILEKRTRWSKTKRPPHVLLSGMMRCGACGKPIYVRFSNSQRGYYYCSSKFPGHGPRCCATSVRQDAADREIERFVSKELLDAGYIQTILGRFQARQPERDHDAERLARKREELEAERQRLLRMTLKGACSEEDFDRESKRIEGEIRDLGRLVPAPAPEVDTAKLALRLQREFARFAKHRFEEKRGLMRATFREIVLGEDGAITGLTWSGAALAECVNSSPRYSASSTNCCCAKRRSATPAACSPSSRAAVRPYRSRTTTITANSPSSRPAPRTARWSPRTSEPAERRSASGAFSSAATTSGCSAFNRRWAAASSRSRTRWRAGIRSSCSGTACGSESGRIRRSSGRQCE
jgi:DNA invertase Pin-like site-specific DNA recombinase